MRPATVTKRNPKTHPQTLLFPSARILFIIPDTCSHLAGMKGHKTPSWRFIDIETGTTPGRMECRAVIRTGMPRDCPALPHAPSLFQSARSAEMMVGMYGASVNPCRGNRSRRPSGGYNWRRCRRLIHWMGIVEDRSALTRLAVLYNLMAGSSPSRIMPRCKEESRKPGAMMYPTPRYSSLWPARKLAPGNQRSGFSGLDPGLHGVPQKGVAPPRPIPENSVRRKSRASPATARPLRQSLRGMSRFPCP